LILLEGAPRGCEERRRGGFHRTLWVRGCLVQRLEVREALRARCQVPFNGSNLPRAQVSLDIGRQALRFDVGAGGRFGAQEEESKHPGLPEPSLAGLARLDVFAHASPFRLDIPERCDLLVAQVIRGHCLILL
jgi:hypothetical protein